MVDILMFFLTLLVIGLGGIAVFVLGIAALIKIVECLVDWVIGNK